MKPLDREQLKHIRGGATIEGGEPRDESGSLTAVPIVGGDEPSDKGDS